MASELDVWIRWCEGEGIETVGELSRDVLGRYHAFLQTDRAEHHAAEDGRRAWTRTVRCSPRTANGRVIDLQTWWAWLADHDVYGPVTPPPRRIALPVAHPALQPSAPTWVDMDAAIAQAKTEWHRRAAWVMRCTGLRPGQTVRLRWADVDLQAPTIRVRPELGKSRQEKRGRVVPMSPVLQREIATWDRPTDPRASLTGGPLAWDYDPWRGMWTRAEVPRERWSRQPCHAWRKGFSSGLRAVGVSKDAVDRLTGHAVGVSDAYVTGEAAGLVEAVGRVPPVKLGRVLAVSIPAESAER